MTAILTMITSLILMIFVPVINGADLPNCLNQPVGHETVTFKDESSPRTLTFSNIRAPETLLKVKDYPTTTKVIKIEKSLLSHLPLVERSWTHKLYVFEIEDTCLSFLAPPQRKKHEENYQPFLKAMEITELKFTRVPFVHGFNWEDANPEILNVVDSQFLSIPESLNKITRLRLFYVRNSGLKWIHRNAFKGLKNVRAIYLNDNDIEHLEAGTFSIQSLSFIEIIHLGGNKIMSIAPGALPVSFQTFVLDQNPLTNLDFKAFEGVQIGTFTVCGTNLRCTCVGLAKVYNVFGTCLTENSQRLVWMKQLYNCKNLDYDENRYPECR